MSVSSASVQRDQETDPSKALTGELRIYQETLVVRTSERLELVNVTNRIRELIQRSGIRVGFVHLTTLHTTVSLFINEWQDALLHDVRSFLEQLIGRDQSWRHNDPAWSDCDRKNADSHLRALLLGHSLSLQIQKAALVLGRFQSIILAELDGPQERGMSVQVIGVA